METYVEHCVLFRHFFAVAVTRNTPYYNPHSASYGCPFVLLKPGTRKTLGAGIYEIMNCLWTRLRPFASRATPRNYLSLSSQLPTGMYVLYEYTCVVTTSINNLLLPTAVFVDGFF